ncbi:MAG: hypothetical protein ABSF59_17620 [Candidatus Sulfotelmatobacter sp.]|jgi:RNA-splicing ligase RtcB
MGINIDHLGEPELIDLNEKIVQRLRLLRQMRAHVQMLNFTLGERVWFQTEEGVVRGTLVKYNKKSVTVVTEDGHRWTVAPGFLRKATKATIIEMGHMQDASRR